MARAPFHGDRHRSRRAVAAPPRAAERFGLELELLEWLSRTPVRSIVRTPDVRHVGAAEEAFPHRWAVLEWLDGVDGWTARDELDGSLDTIATELAAAVLAMRELTGAPVTGRAAGDRGGPLDPLLDRLERWLADPRWNASSLIDVDAVRRVAAKAAEVAAEPVPTCFVHGDLIPGNVLIDGARLGAIIDWGSAGRADPAQDLAPAWAMFDGSSRRIFREAVAADEATWRRAAAFELEHAVGGVLYYVPRGHPLGDVMARTLDRILDDG